jgi:hypothetical protein
MERRRHPKGPQTPSGIAPHERQTMNYAPVPIGLVQYRPGMVELDRTRARGDDRIPIAISSEYPVDRHFGIEVLVHKSTAIDMTHAPEGELPFLDGHDTGRQVGAVEGIYLGTDGVLRGYAHQGNHPDAAWIFADIRAGIRKKISVGYQIQEFEIDDDTYRATRWALMEVSTVAIPADYNVGVGRSDPSLPTEEHMTPDESQQHTRGTASATLAAREQEIKNIVRLASEHGMVDQVTGWLDCGLSREQVSDEILSRRRSSPQPTLSAPGYLDLSLRDAREFTGGFNRALLDTADRRVPGGIIGEVSRNIASRNGRPTPGFYVPLDLSVRASITGNVATTSSLGGAGVETSVLSLIDLLRNKMLTRQAGATVLSGLSGNITFPRHIVANTMAWEGENPSTAHANTAATLDNVTLSPKTAMASSAYSRQFLVQASFDASQFVQNDLASVIAVGLDLAVLDGTGIGEPADWHHAADRRHRDHSHRLQRWYPDLGRDGLI